MCFGSDDLRLRISVRRRVHRRRFRLQVMRPTALRKLVSRRAMIPPYSGRSPRRTDKGNECARAESSDECRGKLRLRASSCRRTTAARSCNAGRRFVRGFARPLSARNSSCCRKERFLLTSSEMSPWRASSCKLRLTTCNRSHARRKPLSCMAPCAEPQTSNTTVPTLLIRMEALPATPTNASFGTSITAGSARAWSRHRSRRLWGRSAFSFAPMDVFRRLLVRLRIAAPRCSSCRRPG